MKCLHLSGRYQAHNFVSATPQKASSTKQSVRAIDAECMIQETFRLFQVMRNGDDGDGGDAGAPPRARLRGSRADLGAATEG